jgi:hypothetical protein
MKCLTRAPCRRNPVALGDEGRVQVGKGHTAKPRRRRRPHQSKVQRAQRDHGAQDGRPEGADQRPHLTIRGLPEDRPGYGSTGCSRSPAYPRPRLLLLRRTLLFCFLPGGPSALPRGVSLLPGFLSLAIRTHYGRAISTRATREPARSGNSSTRSPPSRKGSCRASMTWTGQNDATNLTGTAA